MGNVYPINAITQFEQEEMVEARSSAKMLSICEIAILVVSIFAAGYFGLSALYQTAYVKGYMDKVCGRAECMTFMVQR